MSSLDIALWFARTYDFLEEAVLSSIKWNDFRSVFKEYRIRRTGTPNAYVDIFPILSCVAASGEPEKAVPLAAAWILYLFAARVFDDLQDEEGLDHPWNTSGQKQALAKGLYALGIAGTALKHTQADSDTCWGISEAFSDAIKEGAFAQAELSVTIQDVSLKRYFEGAAAKTGLIFATGAWVGGRLSSAEPESHALESLYDYGLNIGIMSQIIDDCVDLSSSDLVKGMLTLPVIYALSQEDHPKHALLFSLLHESDLTPNRLNEATTILAEMNAVQWSLQIAKVYQNRAIASLIDLPSERTRPLVDYASSNFNLAS